jgi:hypothetical protein
MFGSQCPATLSECGPAVGPEASWWLAEACLQDTRVRELPSSFHPTTITPKYIHFPMQTTAHPIPNAVSSGPLVAWTLKRGARGHHITMDASATRNSSKPPAEVYRDDHRNHVREYYPADLSDWYGRSTTSASHSPDHPA